jgi:hypothetical protein
MQIDSACVCIGVECVRVSTANRHSAAEPEAIAAARGYQREPVFATDDVNHQVIEVGDDAGRLCLRHS